MNGLLMGVGIFVFFLTVYGAVMIGGHLLEELQTSDLYVEPDRPSATSHSDR